MSIPTDDNTGLSDGDAVAQLMASLTPSKEPKGSTPDPEDQDEDEDEQDEDELEVDADKGEEDDQDEEDDDQDDEEDEEADEEEGEEVTELPKAPPVAAKDVPDEAVVKVTVDGQETEFTVGSLKRLAGQEAALTRKSQEADVVGGRAAAVLQGALESVLEDLEPYKGVDWVLEGQRMDPEEFAWHRETFTRLQGRYQKLVGAAQTFDQTMTERQRNTMQERAAEAVKVLKRDIPEWSDKVYADVLQYGVSQGLDENDVSQIADAAVIKILHKAMLHDKAKDVAAKKVNLAPKKVRKSGGREAVSVEGSKSQRILEKKLASGRATDDDAMAALLGRWGVKGR